MMTDRCHGRTARADGSASVLHRTLGRVLMTAGCLAISIAAWAQEPPSCEQAGLAAERSFGLPPGLLVAIGRVEAGRWDEARRQLVVWPWSVDIDGEPRRYASAEAAARDVMMQKDAGRHSIDVGCFQINLGWHPDAFASPLQAFDPVANATYAASFLRSLDLRLGSWPAAVAAYHSANPLLGIPYRDRVMASWSAVPAEPEPWQPVTERFGVRVWTPTTGATRDSVMPPGSPTEAGALPRVVTPAR